jgi:hypothetical protein
VPGSEQLPESDFCCVIINQLEGEAGAVSRLNYEVMLIAVD